MCWRSVVAWPIIRAPQHSRGMSRGRRRPDSRFRSARRCRRASGRWSRATSTQSTTPLARARPSWLRTPKW
eukprot:4363180-Alexandrium_andersonii.AAC.1